MLQAQRRHTKKCNERQVKRAAKNPEEPPKLPPKELRKCDCPLWVIGIDIRGQFHRESLDTRDLTTAAIRIQRLELGEPIAKPLPALIIEAAWDTYTDILQSQRDVKDSSITGSYRPVKNALLRFAEHKGIRMMSQTSETFCDGLVAQWMELEPSTRHHYIQIVQDFFGVAFSRGWIAQDPSIKLVRPKRPVQKCTLPFDLEDEDPRIVAAIPHWSDAIQRPNHNGISVWAKHPATAAALMYVLRFTGVRISDGYLFEPRCLKKRVVNGRDAYCYFLPAQQKTQEPVFIVIRPDVGEYIVNAPRLTEGYAFYDPEGTDPEATTKEGRRNSNEHMHQWGTRFRQDALHYLEKVSGVPHIHPHRFRDTFAIDFLDKDGDIRQLSRLLGHRDVATTLRYYEHYIKSDQKKAVEAMMKTWESEKPINVLTFPSKKQA